MLKKKYEKPKLIILMRVRPEEAVLDNCKGGSWGAYALDASQCSGPEVAHCDESCLIRGAS